MNYTTLAVIIFTLIIVIVLICQYLKAIKLASEKIWSGSGSPISISRILLASLQSNGQILFGIVALVILYVLIDSGSISSEAGLPLFSALAAYLLGKSFKENSPPTAGKSEGGSE